MSDINTPQFVVSDSMIQEISRWYEATFPDKELRDYFMKFMTSQLEECKVCEEIPELVIDNSR